MIRLLYVCLIMLLPGLALAQSNVDLYSTVVPVASEQASDRPQAIAAAWQQILVKISGNSALQEMQALPTNLSDPSVAVRSYSYEHYQDASDKPLLKLRVQFDPKQVDTFLSKEGQSVWKKPRPIVLVWLATQTPTGRQLLANDSDTVFPALFAQNSMRRGIMFMLPQMDLNELNAVSVRDVWWHRYGLLSDTAKRYHSGAVLVGRITQEKGLWHGDWTLVLENQRPHWEISDVDADQMINTVVDKAVDALAKQYAKVTKQLVAGQVLLIVTNVNSVTQYAKVLSYLKGLPMVTQVEILRVEPSQIVFALELNGGVDALQKTLAKSEYMHVQRKNNTSTIASSKLIYKWVS